MVEQVRLAIFYTQWFAILLNEYEPLLSILLRGKLFKNSFVPIHISTVYTAVYYYNTLQAVQCGGLDWRTVVARHQDSLAGRADGEQERAVEPELRLVRVPEPQLLLAVETTRDMEQVIHNVMMCCAVLHDAGRGVEVGEQGPAEPDPVPAAARHPAGRPQLGGAAQARGAAGQAGGRGAGPGGGRDPREVPAGGGQQTGPGRPAPSPARLTAGQ